METIQIAADAVNATGAAATVATEASGTMLDAMAGFVEDNAKSIAVVTAIVATAYVGCKLYNRWTSKKPAEKKIEEVELPSTAVELTEEEKEVITKFNEYFELGKKVPYDTHWENGTGYFDRAVHSEFMGSKKGELWSSQDTSGRKILILTGVGEMGENAIFFQRYSDREDIVIFHAPEPRSGGRHIELSEFDDLIKGYLN